MQLLLGRAGLLSLLFSFIFALTLHAQDKKIHFSFNDGTSASYTLNEVRKITFSGTMINLHLLNGDTESWELSSINQYNFDNSIGILPVLDQVSDLRVFPNPSSGAVSIHYLMKRPGEVLMEIYDIQGKLTKRLLKDYRQTGEQQQIWDATGESGKLVSPGHYICRLIVDGHISSQRIVLK